MAWSETMRGSELFISKPRSCSPSRSSLFQKSGVGVGVVYNASAESESESESLFLKLVCRSRSCSRGKKSSTPQPCTEVAEKSRRARDIQRPDAFEIRNTICIPIRIDNSTVRHQWFSKYYLASLMISADSDWCSSFACRWKNATAIIYFLCFDEFLLFLQGFNPGFCNWRAAGHNPAHKGIWYGPCNTSILPIKHKILIRRFN